MTNAEQAVANVLADGTAKRIEVIARAVNRQIGAVKLTLNALERAGLVRRSLASGGWRLSNGERTRRNEEAKRLQLERGAKRRDDLPDLPGAPPIVPRDGLPAPEPAAKLAGTPEPTDAEIDAVEAEESACGLSSGRPGESSPREFCPRCGVPTVVGCFCYDRLKFSPPSAAPSDPAAPCAGCDHLADYDGKAECNAPAAVPCPRTPIATAPILPAEPENSAPRDPAPPSNHVWGVDHTKTLRAAAKRVCELDQEVLLARERLTELERERSIAIAELRGYSL